jgi:hypothetical protein
LVYAGNVSELCTPVRGKKRCQEDEYFTTEKRLDLRRILNDADFARILKRARLEKKRGTKD